MNDKQIAIASKPLSRTVISDWRNILSNIRTCYIRAYNPEDSLIRKQEGSIQTGGNNGDGINIMIRNVLDRFINKKCTAKEAAKELQNKAMLYLNE